MSKLFSFTIGAIILLNVALIVLWPKLVSPKVEVKKVTAAQYFYKLDSIRNIRDALGEAYKNARSGPKKGMIIDSARSVFLAALQKDVFPQWYGTRWNFYGTSDTPGRGSIACGYFVTTSLRDMGVKLNRVKLAKCSSETMIRSLIEKEYITPYRGKTVEEFVSSMIAKGDGLYIPRAGLSHRLPIMRRREGLVYPFFSPGCAQGGRRNCSLPCKLQIPRNRQHYRGCRFFQEVDTAAGAVRAQPILSHYRSFTVPFPNPALRA